MQKHKLGPTYAGAMQAVDELRTQASELITKSRMHAELSEYHRQRSMCDRVDAERASRTAEALVRHWDSRSQGYVVEGHA